MKEIVTTKANEVIDQQSRLRRIINSLKMKNETAVEESVLNTIRENLLTV